MSETLRNYSAGRKAGRRTRLSLRIPGGFIALCLLVAVPIAIWFYWISRDSRSAEEFIQSNHDIELIIRDPMERRDSIADSMLWSMLPTPHPAALLPAGLRTNFDLPDWMTKNLAGPWCYIAADTNDNTMQEPLIITEITRVGVAIERYHRFRGTVTRDNADRIPLYYWADHGVYYAVRGRVLLACSSRRKLVSALTLSQDERASREILTGLFAAGPEDIKGRYKIAADSNLHTWFDSISFAIVLESDEIVLRALGAARPEFEKKLESSIAASPPSRLPMPPSGMAGISLNIGRPVQESWTALGEIIQSDWMPDARWTGQEVTSTGVFGSVLTGMFWGSGPAVTLAWRGYDLDEMIPAPIVVGRAQGNPKVPTDLEDRVGESQTGGELPGPSVEAGDSEGRWYVSTIGGPSLETAVSADNGWTRFSSSRTEADRFFDERAQPEYAQGNGHIFATFRPSEIVDALDEAGQFLVTNSMLKDHSAESWTQKVAEWKNRWSGADALRILAHVDSGLVDAEIRVALHASSGHEVSTGGE